MKSQFFCDNLKKKIPGGTPLGKVIGRGGMESNVAAATVPPVATAAGTASIIASKTSAMVSAKKSCNLVKVKLFFYFLVQVRS